MQSDSNNATFSEGQRKGLDERRADHDRTLAAIDVLESALTEAAPGREARWRDVVRQALSALGDAMTEEASNARRPDSLLSDLDRTQPRLRNRARALRLQYAEIRDTIESLRQVLDAVDTARVDFEEIRKRLGVLLRRLRNQRARESDLIYEAYYDAFRTDLRTLGRKGTP